MPIMRNPFRKQDENVRPALNSLDKPKSNDGKPVDVAAVANKEPVEYKLSEINDSGVYLPPSPQEKKSFWGVGSSMSRSTTGSTTSSASRHNHRCLINESEQFNISRESFESYRRSFDISARSPVIPPNEQQQQRPGRASLDSAAAFRTPPRPSATFARPAPTSVPEVGKEEELEDVSLEEPKAQQPQQKKGIFSRMMNPSDHAERPPSSSGGSGWHHFGSGRKRGQSGTGQELGSVPTKIQSQQQQEEITREQTPKPNEAQLHQQQPTSAPAQQQQQQQGDGLQNTNGTTPEIRVN